MDDSLPLETEAFLRERGHRERTLCLRCKTWAPGFRSALRGAKLCGALLVAVLVAAASRRALGSAYHTKDFVSGFAAKYPCHVVQEDPSMVVSDAVADAADPCGPPGTEPPAEKYDVWRVVFNGSVNVREVSDLSAKIVGKKWKCDVMSGMLEGNWVKLLEEPGYVVAGLGGVRVLKKLFSVEPVDARGCSEAGMQPIWDQQTCENAAGLLGLRKTTVELARSGAQGCFSNGRDAVWFSSSVGSLRQGSQGGYRMICTSQADVACDSYVTSTVTVTTSRGPTTSTPLWPTFFCWALARVAEGSKDPELLNHQLMHGMGVFSCEEFTAFSHLGFVKIGTNKMWTLGRIFLPPAERGNTTEGAATDSWLNIKVFLVAWRYVMLDSRYLRHDWTVKADPDTVFFAYRLRDHLRPRTTEGSNAFVVNCNSGFKPRLVGSLEVFSRRAVQVFIDGHAKCESMENNQWGEDTFMQNCMNMLGSSQLLDFGMLADNRCSKVDDCSDSSDTKKVAYHGYNSVESWQACFDEAQK